MSDHPPTPPKRQKPVIPIDADEHNANWLRILAQRKAAKTQQKKRTDKQKRKKETPTNG